MASDEKPTDSADFDTDPREDPKYHKKKEGHK